jgi:hypothetical protein
MEEEKRELAEADSRTWTPATAGRASEHTSTSSKLLRRHSRRHTTPRADVKEVVEATTPELLGDARYTN